MENREIAWRFYWIPAALLLMVGIVGSLVGTKSDFLIWLAHHRQVFLDYYFYYITKAGEAPGFFAVGIVLWLSSWRKMMLVPVLAIVTTSLTYGMKSFFQHERPALLLDRMDWVGPTDVLDYHMLIGHTSFPSGHSMAAWSIFTLAAVMIKKPWASLLCLWLAVSVSMSRIYLMAHFLQDVVMGAIIGSLLGYLTYRVYQKLSTRVA